MLHRREGRKAATQALVVIAESIRASRGRRSKQSPPEVLENMTVTDSRDKENTSKSGKRGISSSDLTHSKGILQQELELLGEPLRVSSSNKQSSNKENVKPKLTQQQSMQVPLQCPKFKSDLKAVDLQMHKASSQIFGKKPLQALNEEIVLSQAGKKSVGKNSVSKDGGSNQIFQDTTNVSKASQIFTQPQEIIPNKRCRRKGLNHADSISPDITIDLCLRTAERMKKSHSVVEQAPICQTKQSQKIEQTSQFMNNSELSIKDKELVSPLENYMIEQFKDSNLKTLQSFKKSQLMPEDLKEDFVTDTKYFSVQGEENINNQRNSAQLLISPTAPCNHQQATSQMRSEENQVEQPPKEPSENENPLQDGQSDDGMMDETIENQGDDENMSHSQGVEGGQGDQGCNIDSQYQGRWTQEEHDKFIEGLKLFGKDWRRIEEYIGSRSCAQIRSHAQKYFNRLQRDIARGIKRTDDIEASIALGKKKKRQASITNSAHPVNEESRIFQTSATQRPKLNEHPYQQSTPVIKELLLQTPTVEKDQAQSPLLAQTNQQIQQIHETLSKLTEDDFVMQMKQLVTQREQISLEVLLNKCSKEQAGELLVHITNKFHVLAMQALQACRFDICNRLIDERNLTQFVCILLSKQVNITPYELTSSNNGEEVMTSRGKEIIQRIDIQTSEQ